MTADVLEALVGSIGAHRPAVLVTDTADGRQAVLLPLEEDGTPRQEPVIEAGDPALVRAGGPDLLDEVRRAATEDVSRSVEIGRRELFLRAYNPRPRMIVVGAVHVAQPLASLAATAGFRVTVVDPRRAFATTERFPGVDLVASWPGEALAALAPDHRTAVVTLTHDPKLDDPALLAALDSGAFYVGALGSRRTHARRLERLGGQGVGEADLDRIRGPVGLDIGARTPAEIAVSIVAEAVAALRGSG